MKYDITKFEELVMQGYLRKSENGDLVLYGYTDKCTYERYWNEYTRVARGLILEKSSGTVIAKPFPKFFNLNEMEETRLANLPNEPYTVHEKMDGSLGIVFHYDGQWQVATRGSFYSPQAEKAQELLKKYKIDILPKYLTLLVEIIYPDNKIVVDYGKAEELVLLAAYDRDSVEEQHDEIVEWAKNTTGIRIAPTYTHTIEEMIALQATMPKDEEGFVVRFESGLRVKIKGKEYMRISKLISTMSPISFWENMKDGIVDKTTLAQLPEEFRPEYESIVEALEAKYFSVKCEIEFDFQIGLPTREPSKDGCRTIGMFLAGPNEIRHSGAMFPRLLGKTENLEHYIMKYIRPSGNVLKT